LKTHIEVEKLFQKHVTTIRRDIHMAKARSAKQKANDKRLGKMAKARHAAKSGKPTKSQVKASKSDLRKVSRRVKATHARAIGFTNRTIGKHVKRLKDASWRARKGQGAKGKGKHIPLIQLERNLKHLTATIKSRKGVKGWE
jgi:hypothetical protein